MELNIKVDSEEESKKRIINKTAEYAQNGDHFWNLAIRTSKLPIDSIILTIWRTLMTGKVLCDR